MKIIGEAVYRLVQQTIARSFSVVIDPYVKVVIHFFHHFES